MINNGNPTDPNNVESLIKQGCALIKHKKYLEALQHFNKTLEKDPENTRSLNSKGLCYYFLGKTNHDKDKYKEAIKCYDDALKIEKNNLDVLNNKGNALLQFEWYDEAFKCFDKVLEIDPNNAEGWNNRGYALATIEKFEQAIFYYDKSLEICHNRHMRAEIYNNKGNAYCHLLKYDKSKNGYNYLEAKNVMRRL